jgi:hypothetical protein
MTESSQAKILSSLTPAHQNKSETPEVKRLPSFEIEKIGDYLEVVRKQHRHDQCATKFSETSTWFVAPKIIDNYLDDCQRFRALTMSA